MTPFRVVVTSRSDDEEPVVTGHYIPAPQASFKWWQEVLFYVPIIGWWFGYRRRYWVSLDDH